MINKKQVDNVLDNFIQMFRISCKMKNYTATRKQYDIRFYNNIIHSAPVLFKSLLYVVVQKKTM